MRICKLTVAALLLVATIGLTTLTGCGNDKNKDGKDDTLSSSSSSTTTTTTMPAPSSTTNGTV